MLEYFKWPMIITVLGTALGAWVGWSLTGTMPGTLSIFFITCVLAVLEISLSFDNAIVNANKLKEMTPVWQRRFLTWGILIAVFGMRIVFPLAIVVAAAGIGPVAALQLAASEPQEYARIMNEAHLSIAAFGGTFLMMVGLSYFFDEHKEIHWVHAIESRVARFASVKGVEITLVLLLMIGFSLLVSQDANRQTFIYSAIYGLVTFHLVDILGNVLDRRQEARSTAARGGFGAFLYLEVLDASFSFDGVIGAFALTQNLFVITIGLGIGAMYVRSITLMLVERGTLTQYRYLEHGAFYAILILSVVMYAQTLVHIPEVVTGLGGAALIGLAFWSSVRHNHRRDGAQHDVDDLASERRPR